MGAEFAGQQTLTGLKRRYGRAWMGAQATLANPVEHGIAVQQIASGRSHAKHARTALPGALAEQVIGHRE